MPGKGYSGHVCKTGPNCSALPWHSPGTCLLCQHLNKFPDDWFVIFLDTFKSMFWIPMVSSYSDYIYLREGKSGTHRVNRV